jgi:hypothetical protein
MLSSNIGHFFTYYSPSRATAQNLVGNLGFTSPKLDLFLGQGVGLRDQLMIGGVPGGLGSGLSTTYRPIARININSFYAQGPLFSVNPNLRSYGASVGYITNTNNFQSSVGYVRNDYIAQRTSQQSISSGLRIKFSATQNFMGNVSYVFLQDSIGTVNQGSSQFLNYLTNYSGIFLKGKLSQTLTVSSFNFGQSTQGGLRTFNINNNTGISLNRFGLNLNTSYLMNRVGTNAYLLQIPTFLSFWVKNRLKFNVFPSFFHNYITNSNFQMHQAGIAMNWSKFDYSKNFRFGLNFRGAYNFYQDSLSYAPIFNSNVFAMIAYRTLSANIGYNYGPIDFNGVKQVYTNPGRYPQYLLMSINKQHIFRKLRQFVFEFTFNYSWNNVTYAHNMAFSPLVYYFTKNGWRFNASIFYNLNARNPELSRQFYTYQGTGVPLPEVEPGLQFSNNFNLQFGLRKEFGILLPKKFRKRLFSNPVFIAFLDFNGNRIKDKDEVALETLLTPAPINEKYVPLAVLA